MSDEPEIVIPLDRLPPGFAERVADPGAHVAEAKPAATTVLVRDSGAGPELLLLKRHGSSGFVPGAWVFPGGRVDAADGAPELIRRLQGRPRGPEDACWAAALRELFEETGILLARDAEGRPIADAARDDRLARWRSALLDHRATLLDVLVALDLQPDLRRTAYCSHWITPIAEPRRYDTHFFLSELPAECEAHVDPREMTGMQWQTPAAALAAFQAGTLDMVFPTVKTIQLLRPYRSVDEMLDAFRDTAVPAVLPRLVHTGSGIGIVVDTDPDTDRGEA